jgi:hypothetical protein
MKVKLTILLISMFVLQQVTGQEIWIQKDSLKGPGKASCISFEAYGLGFIGLGRNFDGDKRSMYSYDRLSDDWDKEESLGGEFGSGLDRSSAACFTINEKAYMGTGKATSPYLNDFWEYDPVSDTWSQKANFGGTARRQAVGFSVGSIGYIGTGEDASGFTNDFWSFDAILNQWTEVAPLPGPSRKQAIGVTMGSHGYVGTGYNGTYLNDFWTYDPTVDAWTQKDDFGGTPRYGAATFAVFPNLFIITGYDNTLSYKKDVWMYSYFGDNWVQRVDFPGPARVNATGFNIYGRGYLGTGYNGSYLDDFYEYQFVLSTEENELIQAKTYPNPAQNSFNIELNNADQFKFTLFTLSGKNVTELTSTWNEANVIHVTCDQLNSGVYVSKLVDNDGNVVTNKITLSR